MKLQIGSLINSSLAPVFFDLSPNWIDEIPSWPLADLTTQSHDKTLIKTRIWVAL